MIYTSYFAKLKELEKHNIILISICGTVIKELNYLVPNVNGKDIALICYEKPSDFCHRHLVAEWLNKNGFKCEEWRSK